MKKFSMLGILGPIFSSLLASLVALILILLLKLIAFLLNFNMLKDAAVFLGDSIPYLFFITLMAGYAQYFSHLRRTLQIIAPFLASIAGITTIYFIVNLLMVFNKHLNVWVIDTIAAFVNQNLLWILFALLLVSYLGYLVEFIRETKHN